MKVREMMNVLSLNEKVKIIDSNTSLLWEGYCPDIPTDYFLCDIHAICSLPDYKGLSSYIVISVKK